ncbi:MAG: glycerol-3-phosphate 1-O-acyltransferase PlsY [Chloroflexi bacterium]|nr:glycerol-3-phosphate 1-O-acyltransferase PlsY [Chloroflexota bacterium]
MATVGVIVLGYFLGSVSFGAVLGRLKGVDVRRYGSGRTGVTNVLRTLGGKVAAAVFIGDLAKGVGAVLLARYLVGSDVAQVGAGLAALAGHNWPVFLGFRGGRGVTTGLGGLLALSWPVALMGLGVWLAIIALTRYVSLGSVLGSVVVGAGLVGWSLAGWAPIPYIAYGLGAAALIVFQHRDNISRLLAGTERKLGQPAEMRTEP